MPRRRENQCEMSAISGPKMADDPTPISRPWTSVNWMIDVVTEASPKPAASISEATSAGRQ